MMSTQNLLVELFVEELPPKALKKLGDAFAQQLAGQLRAQGLATLPSTMALERSINPFLRSGEADVIASARAYDARAVDRQGVFATLREWKNHYR